MYILAIGTLVNGFEFNGFEFIGPFPDVDAAVAYGERHSGDMEWWVVPLDQPKED